MITEKLQYKKNLTACRITALSLMLASVMLFLSLTTPSVQCYAQNFSVTGSTIKDPAGNNFVARGANVGGEKYSWGRPTATAEELSAIKDKWKLNMLRSNHYAIRSTTKGGSPLYSGSTFADVVNMYTPHQIVVMEELHDFTGSLFETMTSADEQKLMDFWKARAIQYKNNPYVWFNLINEPGGSTNSAQYYDKWVSLHRSLISMIRAQGANNIIVVDGMWFGQDAGNSFDSDNILDSESAILSRGLDILSGNSNIVFSIHTYAQWGGGTSSRLANFVDRVRAKGMALIFGEAGAAGSSTVKWKAGAEYGFIVAEQKNVGILAWHWQPGDDFDMTTGGDGWGKSVNSSTNPTNLTTYGRYLWDLTHPASSCTNPAAPGALSLAVVSSSQINLTWADYSTIEDGYKIERKQGSTGTYLQVATVGANVTSYQSTGLAASTTYYYRIRAFDGNTCNSSYSAEKSATTLAASSGNLLVNAGFETGSLSPWSGTQVYISSEKRTGSHGARLGSSGGASATLQQTVSGLKANTTYTLRAWLRVGASGISVQLGVDGYGGSKTATAITSTSYTQSSISFTTGSSNTSARVYVSKPSTSVTLAYADDFELIEGTGTLAAKSSIDTIFEDDNGIIDILSLEIYPNPAFENATISVTSKVSGLHQIKLFDFSGKELYADQINLEAFRPRTIDLSMERFESSTYILRVTNSKGSKTEKIIKIE